MQQDNEEATAAAPLQQACTKEANATRSSPATAAEAHHARVDLAEVVDLFVRKRTYRAYNNGAPSHEAPNDLVGQKEEMKIMAAAQLVESQLLQCLLRVCLNPSELPRRPELAGDICVPTMCHTGGAEGGRAEMKHTEEVSNATVAPPRKGDHPSRHSVDMKDRDHRVHDMGVASATAAVPTVSCQHSPPPRPLSASSCIAPDAAPPSAAAVGRQRRRRPSEHRGGARTHSAPTGGGPSTTIAAPPSLSGTKAKELYYAYTHQNMPPPTARPRGTPASATSPSVGTRASSAPAHHTISAIAVTHAADDDTAKGSVHAEAAQPPLSQEERRRRRHSSSERRRHRTRHADGEAAAAAAPAAVSLPLSSALEASQGESSVEQSGTASMQTNSEEGTQRLHKPPSHGETDEQHSALYRTRRGTIRPLLPSEVAAAVGSWPSCIAQYTLARQLAEDALSRHSADDANPPRGEKAVESDNAGNHDTKAVSLLQSSAPDLVSSDELLEQNAEFTTFLRSLRGVVRYTTLSTRVAAAADGAAFASAYVSFPSFTRFYLSDLTQVWREFDEEDGDGCVVEEGVQRVLFRLMSALVSATMAPETDSKSDGALRDVDHTPPCNKANGSYTAEVEGAPWLPLTDDLVENIGVFLRHTPTILTVPALPQPIGEANAGSPRFSLPKPDVTAAASAAASRVTPARLVAKRALWRHLHLSPSSQDAGMVTTPLVVGVLRRYDTMQTLNCSVAASSHNGSGNGAGQDGRAGELQIRFLPAAEVMPSTSATSPYCHSSPQRGGASNMAFPALNGGFDRPTPLFYNTLLIEVTGDDITYAADDASDDALPVTEEEEAKMVYTADVPDTYLRQRSRHREEQRTALEASVRAGLAEERDGAPSAASAAGAAVESDVKTARPRLSRQQCVAWQQLLALSQFVHVTGTPAQVETTARYVALAIRHRREIRQQHQQQQQQQRNPQSPLLMSSASLVGVVGATAPSIAECALSVSVPAFFFTLTQTPSLAAPALTDASRVLQYDDEDDKEGGAARCMMPDAAEGVESAAHAAQPRDTRNRQSGPEDCSGGSLSPPPASSSAALPSTWPSRKRGVFASGAGFGLGALLGWRTTSTAPPPPSGPSEAAPVATSPPRRARQPSPYATAAPAPPCVAVSTVPTVDDIILWWMHDALIPLFYETTVTCSEAEEGATVSAAGTKSNRGSGSRHHRYRLRRQRALLGRVQVITPAMVLHSSNNNTQGGAGLGGDHPTPSADDATAPPTMHDNELISYLLLNQLFFDAGTHTSETAADAASTKSSAAPRAASRRAHSAPSAVTASALAASYHTAEDSDEAAVKPPSQPSSPFSDSSSEAHHHHRRALSATPHRSKRSSSQPQRRVSFCEEERSEAPLQVTAVLEMPTAADKVNAEMSTTTAAAASAASRVGSLSSSPKSILKSGRRYKAEKLVRSSAPATSVVPFRSFFLWRWLAAEVMAPEGRGEGEGDDTALRTAEGVCGQGGGEGTRGLRAVQLSPILHLSSAAYLAAAQTLAVRVATDIATVLLLTSLQAEQYACYQQLQHPSTHTGNEKVQDKRGEPSTMNTDDTVAGESHPPDAPPHPDVLEARHASAFQGDDILPLAKMVAEAVVQAALTPVAYAAGVPKQLQSLVQEGNIAATGDSAEDTAGNDSDDDGVRASLDSVDATDEELGNPHAQCENTTTAAAEAAPPPTPLCLKRRRRGGGRLPASNTAVSVLSPALSPYVLQQFQVLLAVCVYRVQQEVLESVTRPLDLALRRFTWGLGQHHLQVLCRPLLDFWRSVDITALSDAAAATAATRAASSFSKNAIDAHELQKKCGEAEHRLRVLVSQVLQLFDECLLLPHLLTATSAPRSVQLTFDQEGNNEGHVGGGATCVAPNLEPSHLHEEGGTSHLSEADRRYLSPLSPLRLEHPLFACQRRDHLTAEYTSRPSQQQQQQPSPASPWRPPEAPVRQPQNRHPSMSDLTPLSVGEAKLHQRPPAATSTSPVEGSITPHQQPLQNPSLPQWSFMTALTAWNPAAVDVNGSSDLHSSLCCDWRSMRLSGGAMNGMATAASDFALAVTVASPLQVCLPPAFQIAARVPPAGSMSPSPCVVDRSMIITATTAATATSVSTPGAMLSASNLVLTPATNAAATVAADDAAGGVDVHGYGGNRGKESEGGPHLDKKQSTVEDTAHVGNPAAICTEAAQGHSGNLRQRLQSCSVSCVSPRNCMHPLIPAAAAAGPTTSPPPASSPPLRGHGGSHITNLPEVLRSPLASPDAGPPTQPRVSSRWQKLPFYHEEQQRLSLRQVDWHSTTSQPSFLTFTAVTPMQQNRHVPVCGAATATAEGNDEVRGSVGRDVTAAAPSPTTHSFSQPTQPPAPVVETKQSAPTDARAAAALPVVEGEEEGELKEEGTTAPAATTSTVERPGLAHTHFSPHYMAQLRNGNIVESRLLRPFVADTKGTLVGLLLQKWVLPRWGFLVQMRMGAAKQTERQVAPDVPPVQRTSAHVQTDVPPPTHLQPSPPHELQQRDERKGSFLDGDSVDHQHDADGGTVYTFGSSLDAPALVDANKATRKPNTSRDYSTLVATPLPPLPSPAPFPLLTVVPPPAALAAAADVVAEDNITANVGASVEHVEGETAELPARVLRIHEILDSIVRACRDLSAAAVLCEPATALDGPLSSSASASNVPRLQHDDGGVVEESGSALPKHNDVPTPLISGSPNCVISSPLAMPTGPESSPAIAPPPPSAPTAFPLHPLPSTTAASRDLVRIAREESARIISLCDCMTNLLVSGEELSSLSRAGDFLEGQPPLEFISARGDGGDGQTVIGCRGAAGDLLDRPLQTDTASLGSLSRGLRSPEFPTPPDTSASGTSNSQQQQQLENRRGSFPLSVGPSQLFAPLHRIARRSSTAFTLTSVAAPLIRVPSTTLISTMPSSERDNGDDDGVGGAADSDMSVLAPAALYAVRSGAGATTAARVTAGVGQSLAASSAIAPSSSRTSVEEGAEEHRQGAQEATTEEGEGSKADELGDVALCEEKARNATVSLGERAEGEAVPPQPALRLRESGSASTPRPTSRHDSGQQTLKERLAPRSNAETQTPAAAPAERHNAECGVSDPQTQRAVAAQDMACSRLSSSGSDVEQDQGPRQLRKGTPLLRTDSKRSVDTVEVTPCKRHHHCRRTASGREDGEGHAHCDDTEEGDDTRTSSDDDHSSSTLSPVSEHSSNRMSNAVASGRSSPMPSAVSFSSVTFAAAYLPHEAQQRDQQQRQGSLTTRGGAPTNSGNKKDVDDSSANDADLRDVVDVTDALAGVCQELFATPPPSTQPLSSASRQSGEKEAGAKGSGVDATRRGTEPGTEEEEAEVLVSSVKDHHDHEEGADNNNKGSAEARQQVVIAASATHDDDRAAMRVDSTSTSPAKSAERTVLLPLPFRERTPVRTSEAAVTALADLQQRLGGSNSTVVELRERLDKAEADARAQELLVASLQQQLTTTETALRKAVASQEAELERLQLHPPPPLTAARCSVAVSTTTTTVPDDTPALHPPHPPPSPLHQEQQRSLLSPSASSTPVRQERTGIYASGDGAEDATEVTGNGHVMREDTATQVSVEPSPLAAAAAGVSLPVATSSAASQTTPPDQPLVASQLSAERQVRELEADLRNATFRINQWKALLEAERHARAVQVDQLSQQLGSEQRRQQRRYSSNGSASRSRSRSLSPFDASEKPPTTTAGVMTEVCSDGVVLQENLGSFAVRDAEEKRLAAALMQQAEELKVREDALTHRIAHVLDRLHTTERCLAEQRQQAKREAAAEAAAREQERTQLKQRVAEVEAELAAVLIRQEQSIPQEILEIQNTSSSRIEAGVQTDDTLGAQEDAVRAAVAAAVAEATRTHEMREEASRVAQQHLREELRAEQQGRSCDRAAQEKEVASLSRSFEKSTRETERLTEALEEERTAHERTRMALSAAQAAVAATHVAHAIEQGTLQRTTAGWWAAFEDLCVEWAEEKTLLTHRVYAEQLRGRAARFASVMAGAAETAAAQAAALQTLQAALEASRDTAAQREAALRREVEALQREMTSLATTHAASITLHQVESAHAVRLREGATAWWAARDATVAEWQEAKYGMVMNTYDGQLHMREQVRSDEVGELHSLLATHKATIQTLQGELSLAQHKAEELTATMRARDATHQQEAADWERLGTAHVAVQEAQRRGLIQFLRNVEMWWTAREACLSNWAGAKLSSAATAFDSTLRAVTHSHKEAMEQATAAAAAKATAAAAATHETVLADLRQQLSEAQCFQRETDQKLQQEAAAHDRTVAALQATQAAAAVMRKTESAQQSRLQRSTTAWWVARERCVSEWVAAMTQLLHQTYTTQQRYFCRSFAAAANEHLQRTLELQTTMQQSSVTALAANAAAGTLSTPAPASTAAVHDNGVSGHRNGKSHSSAKRIDVRDDASGGAGGSRSPRRSRSPDVVLMSLEDPLGLRYDLQRKSRLIHSLEEKVRQLEAAHLSDQQALTTLQLLLQQERRGTSSPPFTIGAVAGGTTPPPLPLSPSPHHSRAWPPVPLSSAASTPSRTPSHGWRGGGRGSGGGDAMPFTPLRTPNSVASRRLTPSEYRQRFVGM
jgi:hypothetical protein